MNAVFDIPVKAPFSFAECLWFLNRNFDECLHRLGPDHVVKAIKIADTPVLMEVSGDVDRLRVKVLQPVCSPAIKQAITVYLREWFDLDRDIRPFYGQLRKYPALAYMTEDFRGLRLVGIPDLFEAVAWSIIGQQINLKFAYRLKRRIVEAYGEVVEHDGVPHYIFPEASRLAAVQPGDLRAMQFSAGKAQYLVTAARAFADGLVSKEMLLLQPDHATRQKTLTAIKGIGVWTANYALMKSLGEQSSIPFGDAGLLNALLRHSVIDDKTDQAKMAAFFQQFPGWESYVVFYCWRSLSRSDLQR